MAAEDSSDESVGHASPAILSVGRLSVELGEAPARMDVVREVTFTLTPGETLALVGESGCGKSMTALAVLGLLPRGGRITSGHAIFKGKDLVGATDAERRAVRGAGIGMVFQEPSAALSPVLPIGDQIAEALVAHRRAGWTAARALAIELLEAVRIADPAARARDYPHQLSGGQRQRAMLAIALACDPPVLFADEPTTALDVTVQADVLDVLAAMQARRNLAVLLITHDLGVVATRADRVAVMYAGRIVEEGPVDVLFRAPAHPYARALVALAADGTMASGRRLPVIEGSVPSPADVPPGCAFEPRCPERRPACRTAVPAPVAVGPGHIVSCILHGSGAPE